MTAEQIRAFIAIELPGEIQAKLDELENQLKSNGVRSARWVNPENIHLTLKFLGDIDKGRVDEITKVIGDAACGISPFSIEVKETGVFPDLRRTRVAWVGLSGDLEKLLLLQKQIETGMVPFGFPAEARDFTPHLTLARVNDQATPEERRQFGQLFTGIHFDGGIFHVESVNLIRSQLFRTGAVYTRLGQVGLKG